VAPLKAEVRNADPHSSNHRNDRRAHSSRRGADGIDAEVEENLATAAKLVARPPNKGEARRAPRIFLHSRHARHGQVARGKDGAGPIQEFLSGTAKRHGIWLVGGSVPLETADSRKVRNSCLVYASTDGASRVTTRSTFGLSSGGTLRRGKDDRSGHPTLRNRIAVRAHRASVCYDVRFPELYRALAPMDIILVPRPLPRPRTSALGDAAAGPSDRKPRLGARAGPRGSTRTAADSRHSMVVDPGQGHRRAGRRPGVVTADIDPMFQAKMRLSLPALAHRRL